VNVEVQQVDQSASVDLHWIPLGAGGHSVAFNGKVFEAMVARFGRGARRDPITRALEVVVPGGRYVVEMTPVRDNRGAARGVVSEGSVGSRWAGRFRLFRHEIHRWRGVSTVDADAAVASPIRVTTAVGQARRLLELVPSVPTRVEHRRTAKMWVTPMLKFADRLALVVLLLAAVAAAAGLLVSGVYRDTAEGVRQARATDLVTLLVAVPALALGLWRARAGSASGRLVAVGALAYVAYSYAIYAFSVVIDPLTPVHIAIFGLATWSLVLAALGLDAATINRASGFRLPRRATGGFLIVVAALFAMLWLSEIAGAITSGHLPTAISDLNLPTSPVFSLDLDFAVPLIAVAGGWLIRRDRRGPASATAGLAFLIILGLSVLAIFAFEAAAGIVVEIPPIVIFGAVTGTAAALLGSALTGSRRETSS
jgi:hypothetical protein